MILTADGFEVPEEWEYDKRNLLDDNHYECKLVESVEEKHRIAQTAGIGLSDIVWLRRIQNWNLYHSYQVHRKHVKEIVNEVAPETIVEKQLFHGTKYQNAMSISKNGFNRDYTGSNLG